MEQQVTTPDVGVGQTPNEAGVTPAEAVVTPGQGTDDVAKLRQEIEQTRQRAERDIAALKSSLQSQQAKAEREWSKKEQDYQRQLEEFRMGTMDEKDRELYRQKLNENRAQELWEQNQVLQMQIQEAQARQNYTNWFLNQGISLEKINVTGTTQELVDSGWQAMSERMKELETKVSQPINNQVQPQTTPPKIVQPQGGAPVSGPTWSDLIAKYGSMEQVYSLVENGTLPPSILPT